MAKTYIKAVDRLMEDTDNIDTRMMTFNIHESLNSVNREADIARIHDEFSHEME